MYNIIFDKIMSSEEKAGGNISILKIKDTGEK